MHIVPLEPQRIRTVRHIYNRSFPRAERRPFDVNLHLMRRGVLELLTDDATPPACMICAAPWRDLVLIDYLAVDEAARGRGIGAEALRAILARYAGRRVFLEIERPEPDDPPDSLRRRRKGFYLRAGFSDTGLESALFGVPMQLLSHDCALSFEEYVGLYRAVYGKWAAAHVLPLDKRR